jgi:hypothetical protein
VLALVILLPRHVLRSFFYRAFDHLLTAILAFADVFARTETNLQLRGSYQRFERFLMSQAELAKARMWLPSQG